MLVNSTLVWNWNRLAGMLLCTQTDTSPSLRPWPWAAAVPARSCARGLCCMYWICCMLFPPCCCSVLKDQLWVNWSRHQYHTLLEYLFTATYSPIAYGQGSLSSRSRNWWIWLSNQDRGSLCLHYTNFSEPAWLDWPHSREPYAGWWCWYGTDVTPCMFLRCLLWNTCFAPWPTSKSRVFSVITHTKRQTIVSSQKTVFGCKSP